MINGKLSKVFVALVLLLATLTGILLVGTIMAVYPYKPLRVDSFRLDKTVATHGEKVCILVTGEKLMDVPVHILIELVDGESYEIMRYGSNTPPGDKFKPRSFIVPHHIKPGMYRVRWTGVYPVNALNHVRYTFLSEYIEIKDETEIVGKQGPKGEKGDRGGFSIFEVK
jgi:hypothetical protein